MIPCAARNPGLTFRFGAFALASALLCAASGASAQRPDAPPHAAPQPAAQPSALDTIVAAEVQLGTDEWRAPKLAQSSRRHEMISISSPRARLKAFIAYPDANRPVPVVLMVPEDQGLNNWARLMADEIAAMGYVVIVPDMLSGRGPNGGGRESFPDLRSIFAAHSMLPRTEERSMTADLNAWADYGRHLRQFNGKLATVGFAWGGGRVLWFATQRKDLSAVFVFYDAAPPAEKLAGLTAPVYGFYADIDPRVTQSLPGTRSAMESAGKTYEAVVYPGSEHMFVRLGEEPRNTNPANIEARDKSLARLQELLGRL